MQLKIPYPPKIFQVNWFRKDEQGKYLWPGYGENMRVLKWMLDRVHGRLPAKETLVGWVPRDGDLDLVGAHVSEDDVRAATSVNLDEWRRELDSYEEFFQQLGVTAPEALLLTRKLLMARLKDVA